MANPMSKKQIVMIGMIPLVILASFLFISNNPFKSNDDQSLESTPPDNTSTSYTSITMQDAQVRLANETDYILLDVRHDYEYEEGHIPSAILLDNDVISATTVAQLSNKNQTIFVYCRSGRRSKEAAQKLVDLGYTNVVEIGGIIDWTGDIEK